MKRDKDDISIEKCTMDDYSQIVSDICDFWGSDRTLYIHHPYLIHEFGNTAFVIKHESIVIAYLFGFYSQTENTAYVHLIGVRVKYQGKGLGKSLYDHFINLAREKNINKIKAITKPSNIQSIKFHRDKIGMKLLGEPNANDIPVVTNYSGIGEDRVVFEKEI